MNKLLTFCLALLPAFVLAQTPLSPDQTVRGNGQGKVYPDTDLALGNTLAATPGPSGTLKTKQPINEQTGTTYPIGSSDCGSIIQFNNASPVAVSLSAATTPGFGSGCTFEIKNIGVGLVTVTATTSLIVVSGSGAATLPVPTATSCLLASDGVNYLTTSCTAAQGSPLLNSLSLNGGLNADGKSTFAITGTQVATTGTGAFGGFMNEVFHPNGPINVDAWNTQIHLGNANGNNIGNFEDFFPASMIIDADYAGTTPSITWFECCNVYTDNRTGGTAANPSPHFYGFSADPITNGIGATTGNSFNYQFNAASTAVGAATGGTITNANWHSIVPSGGSTGGSTFNYGQLMTGNGGTNISGSTFNEAYAYLGTLSSEFDGGLIDTPISGSTGSFTTLAASSGLTAVSSNTAAPAGTAGELQYVNCVGTTNGSQTVTMTIASPAVVSWATAIQWATSPNPSKPAVWTCPITFSTTGALPTGLTAGTAVWVVGASVSGLNFDVADSAVDALACTSSFGSCTGIINTTGTQSGTQTGTMGGSISTTTWSPGVGIALVAGDWDCVSTWQALGATLTTTTGYLSAVNTTNNAAPAGVNLQNFSSVRYSSVSSGSEQLNLASPPTQELLNSTTPIYGIGQVIFGGGTTTASALLRCRRMR